MKFYHGNEFDKIYSEDDIRKLYEEFGKNDGFDNYYDYLNECMAWNNGDLTPLAQHIRELKQEYNRYKYQYDDNEIFYAESHIGMLEDLLKMRGEETMKTSTYKPHVISVPDLIDYWKDDCIDFVWVEIKGKSGIRSDEVFYLKVTNIESEIISFSLPLFKLEFGLFEYNKSFRIWNMCPSDNDMADEKWD